jgi:hypothetical protein
VVYMCVNIVCTRVSQNVQTEKMIWDTLMCRYNLSERGCAIFFRYEKFQIALLKNCFHIKIITDMCILFLCRINLLLNRFFVSFFKEKIQYNIFVCILVFFCMYLVFFVRADLGASVDIGSCKIVSHNPACEI